MFLRTISAAASRVRVLTTQFMARLGLRGDTFLLILAVIVGLVTAAAAVGFHELTLLIRDALYERFGEGPLYGRWILMLIVWPTLGGIAVGVISNVILRAREGHGIVDVIESVIRSAGFIRPRTAVEKILTAAVTIGSGGSAGAEGPIVQIGAAIASGVGSLFRIARGQMPTIIACGSAAGISAIFNSPMGGMLFALEVILQDFSIRNVTPVVIASVIANVETKWIFTRFFHSDWQSIFPLKPTSFAASWTMVGYSIILGILCGLVGVALTKLMYFAEARFAKLAPSRIVRPAIGGGLLGLMGILYVMIFGWWLFGQHKPIRFQDYPMPAFYGDGYGFIQLVLNGALFHQATPAKIFLLLLFLIPAKLLGTTLTLGSGGSGGIIAPALFLGAVTGGLMGLAMGSGVPGAVRDPRHERGAGRGRARADGVDRHPAGADEQLNRRAAGDARDGHGHRCCPVHPAGFDLHAGIASSRAAHGRRDRIEPASPADGRAGGSGAHHAAQARRALSAHPRPDASQRRNRFCRAEQEGLYCGMVLAEDIREALVEREAIPLLTVEELVRADIPMVTTQDDLSRTMDVFATHEVGHLPVCFPGTPGRVIGLISRSGLMLRYQRGLAGAA
jgi:CIC family chloride channel protein